jgi:hypothetical protein
MATADGVFLGNYNVFEETIDPAGKIQTILSNEQKRLGYKKLAIDPLYNTKQRQDSQLRSITLRKNAYTYMFLVTIFSIGMVTILFIIKNNFPVPEWLMNILLMVTIGGSIVYIIILFLDILKRDTADFEKVDFGLLVEVDKVKDPATLAAEGGTGVVLGTDPDAEAAASGVSGSADVNCVGSKCCPTGSFFWGNKCRSTESFSTKPPSQPSSFSQMPSFTPV